MQFELSEGLFENQTHPLLHESLARIRYKGVIAERPALKSATDHFVDINDSHNVIRHVMNHQKAVIPVRVKALQISRKLLFGSRLGTDPSTMQVTASMNCGEKGWTVL